MNQVTAERLKQLAPLGVSAAAKALGAHTTTLHRIAKQHGVEFGANNTTKAQYLAEKSRKAMAPKIRAMAARRMTQAQMCKELGVSRFVLRRAAREARININSRSLY
ncbi:hypothetical protein KLEP174_gp66 [Pseudomonas phage vB_PcuM_ KLEP17-4]|nr:hypothetical protein KLEP174_gp66 [Pseudomonas phage vB_PcuM_ KLEP17-4]